MGPAGAALTGIPLGSTMMLTGVGPRGPAITGMLAPLGPGAMLTTTPPRMGGLAEGRGMGRDDGVRVGTRAEPKVGAADAIKVGGVEGTVIAEGRGIGSTETNTDGTVTPPGRMAGPGLRPEEPSSGGRLLEGWQELEQKLGPMWLQEPRHRKGLEY